jgi:hypothetical protein
VARPTRLSEEDATDERGDVVESVHSRVYHHGGAGAEKGCQGVARDQAHRGVEEGVTFGFVQAGAGE